MSNACIIISDLSVGYTDKVVQQGLNLTINRGEMVALLGPNGAGKSTLLRTIAGLQPAIKGSTNLSGLTAHEMSQRVALVLTENHSVEQTTVKDIVAMGRYPYTSFLGGLTAEDEQQIADALAKVGMESYSARMFNSLSDGEKQRVLIAKAIAQQTDIILLDEPTAHLDLPSRILTFRLLASLAHEQGKTVLLSTHELDLALHLSDRILLMWKDGVRLDRADTLKAQDCFTRAFGMDIFNAF